MKVLIPFLMVFLTIPSAYSQALDWTWAQHYGGTQLDRIHDIGQDKAGDLYVAGYFKDSLLVGSSYLQGEGMEDILVAKLDSSDGSILWLKTFGSPMQDYGLGLACDEAGNCYISGILSGTGTVDFGGIPLSIGAGGSAMFLARLDSSGQVLWAQTMNGSSPTHNAIFRDIEVDARGNAYVTGYFSGAVTFDNQTVNSGSSGNFDLYLARFSPAGTLDWIQTAGDSDLDQGYGLALSDSGFIYVTGHFRGQPGYGTQTLNGQGLDDIMVVKYDSSGQVIWAREMGSSGWESGRAITVDRDGSCYLTGFYDGTAPFSTLPVLSQGKDLFVLKYDAQGQFQWARTAGSPGSELGWDVACDGNGQVFVTAQYEDGLSLQGNLLSSQGAVDAVLIHYNAQGDLISYRQVSSNNVDVGYRILLDGKTRGYLVGSFSNTGTFGSQSLLSNGSQDGFVAQFEHINTTPIGPTSSLPTHIVFPNPNRGSFRITPPLPPGCNLVLYNMQGQEVHRLILPSAAQQLEFPVPSGSYFLTIFSVTQQFIGQEIIWIRL